MSKSCVWSSSLDVSTKKYHHPRVKSLLIAPLTRYTVDIVATMKRVSEIIYANCTIAERIILIGKTQTASGDNMRSESIMTETTTSTLPRWIWIYANVVMVFIDLSLVLGLIVSPGSIFPELAGENLLLGPAKIFVIMNLASVLATIFVLYRRSASMILLLFMIRLLTNIPDYTFSVISGDPLFPFVLFLIFVYWVPCVWGIRTLWRSKG